MKSSSTVKGMAFNPLDKELLHLRLWINNSTLQLKHLGIFKIFGWVDFSLFQVWMIENDYFAWFWFSRFFWDHLTVLEISLRFSKTTSAELNLLLTICLTKVGRSILQIYGKIRSIFGSPQCTAENSGDKETRNSGELPHCIHYVQRENLIRFINHLCLKSDLKAK